MNKFFMISVKRDDTGTRITVGWFWVIPIVGVAVSAVW